MKTPAVFPPPPDVEPNKFAPIEFVRAGGGLSARLGVIEIGTVRPMVGKVLAYWSSSLPGGPMARPCASIEVGRGRLAEFARDWFLACGHPLPDPSREK